MRHWIILVSMIALLLYVGLVMDHGKRQTAQSAPAEISTLERALRGAGASLERASFRLVAPIADPAMPGRLQEQLGWVGAPPSGEYREARLYTDKGMYYLAVEWRMEGAALKRWTENHRRLTSALLAAGLSDPVHVQLEGKTPGRAKDLLAVSQAALDAVGAGERQPWSGDKSASVAGWSQQLPKGPHSVNIQAAARSTGDTVRLWVAWPAITGDY